MAHNAACEAIDDSTSKIMDDLDLDFEAARASHGIGVRLEVAPDFATKAAASALPRLILRPGSRRSLVGMSRKWSDVCAPATRGRCIRPGTRLLTANYCATLSATPFVRSPWTPAC